MAEGREVCPDCKREIANEQDEGIHNTGECGCEVARKLCWRKWHAKNECRQYSIYDPVYGLVL